VKPIRATWQALVHSVGRVRGARVVPRDPAGVIMGACPRRGCTCRYVDARRRPASPDSLLAYLRLVFGLG